MNESVSSVAMTLDRMPQAARIAREFVRGWLDDSAPAEKADDALLIVSELVTNAVSHGGDEIVVSLARRLAGCRIEVFDSGLTTSSPVAEAPDCTAERGRGLAIVSELAAVGQTLDLRGTKVWAELSW